jgi:ribosomal protein S18 acetylase RimI-like enzyme
MRVNMMEKNIGNGFIIKELPLDEYRTYVNPLFDSVFHNRADDYRSFEVDDNSRQKISQRNKAERFQLSLVVFKGDEVVGWHHGFEKEPDTYYMQNSAVLESYRNQGIYLKLLDVILQRIQEDGFQVVLSTHHPHNAAVLIPKIRRGFFISGMQFHERFRSLVEMKFIFSEQRRKNYFKTMGLEL